MSSSQAAPNELAGAGGRAAPSSQAAANDLIVRLVSSGGAAGVAEAATLPLDMAKVRLQVQVRGAGAAAAAGRGYSGLLDCLVQVASKEGAGGLWGGLNPALIRQVAHTSLTFVLFEPLVKALSGGRGERDATFLERLAAGGAAGALSVVVLNPTEVLKTRMQVAVRGARPSLEETMRRIYETSGMRGYWAGVGPSVARTFLVKAAELGTYAHARSFLEAQGVPEGLQLTAGSSFAAGVAAALVSTPADVVKTRLMSQAGSVATGGVRYEGAAHALFHPKESILAREGAAALYKGFAPIVARRVLWGAVFFSYYEHFRAQMSTWK